MYFSWFSEKIMDIILNNLCCIVLKPSKLMMLVIPTSAVFLLRRLSELQRQQLSASSRGTSPR